MEDIKKHIDHYEKNSTLKSVVLRSFDQRIFSEGTDYDSILFALNQQNIREAKRQLECLFEFSDFMASTNLALVVSANGKILNSAAAIFTNLPFVYCEDKTILKFNEIDRNSPLLGGSSYTLSRLKGNLGMFLGLTGHQLGGNELKEEGLIKDFAEIDHVNVEHMKKYSIRTHDYSDYRSSYRPIFKHSLNKMVDLDVSIREYFKRTETENSKNVLFDLFYRKKIIEHANYQIKHELKNPKQWLNESDQYYQNIENYLFKFEFDVLDSLPERLGCEHNEFSKEQRNLINQVFSSDSLESIFEKLAQDDSDFAQAILKTLKSKNISILEIIFRQIRTAEAMAFGESLKMEYATVCNMIEHQFMKNMIFTRLKNDETNLEKIDLIESSFIQARKFGDEVFSNGEGLNTVFSKHPLAFLPVKEYYEVLPEAFRCYFNSQPLKRAELNINYHDVVKSYLLRYGIDHFNPTFDKNFVLSKLHQYFQWNRKFEVKENRVFELVLNENAKNSYFHDRLKEIERFLDEGKAKERLESIISLVFKDQLIEEENSITNRSNTLGRLTNAHCFEDFKKLIIERFTDSIIISDEQREYELNLLKNLPIDIGFDRFQLSLGNQVQSKIETIRSNFSTEMSIKTKKELKKFYKGGLPPDTKLYIQTQIADHEVIHDKNHIVTGMHEEEPKVKPGTSERLGFYLLTKKETKIQSTFRQQFYDNIIKTLEEGAEPLTEAAKREIIGLMDRDIILKYENVDTLDEVLKLTKTDFLHFCRQMRPSYESFDINKFDVKGEEALRDESLPNKIDEIDFQELQKFNELTFSESKTSTQTNSLKPNKQSLYMILFEMQILNQEQSQQLKSLIFSSKHKFCQDLSKELEEIYKTKFYDLFESGCVSLNLSTDMDGLKGHFNRHFNEEFKSDFAYLMVPHLIFNLSNFAIKKLDLLYNRVSTLINEIERFGGRIENNYTKLAKILIDSGFACRDEAEVLENLNLFDHIIHFMVDLNFEFKQKLAFKEDLIKMAMAEVKEVMRIKLNVLEQHAFKSSFRFFESDILTNLPMFKELEMELDKENQSPLQFERYLEKFLTTDEPEGILGYPIQQVKKSLFETYYKPPHHPYVDFNEGLEDGVTEEMYDFRDQHRPLARFAMDEHNIFNKLKSYQEFLSEFISRVNLNDDRSYLTGHLKKADNLDRDNPATFQKIIDNLNNGAYKTTMNLQIFMEEKLKFNRKLFETFQAVNEVVHMSMFLETISKSASMHASMQHGVYANTAGSRIFETQNLRNTIIKKNLIEKKQKAEKPKEWYTEKYLSDGIFTYAQKLDSLSKAYFQNVNSGCLEPFYYNLTPENTKIPTHFNELDQRQRSDQWLEIELYKYVSSIFQAVKQNKENSKLDYQSENVNIFFSKNNIREHLNRKLYHELFVIEKMQANYEGINDQVFARIANASRTDPDLLNWKKRAENEQLVKKFLAFEAFAFHGSETSKSKVNNSFDYLLQLSKELHEPKRIKTEVAEKQKETRVADIEFVSERLFDEVISTVSENKHSEADSLAEDLSNSLIKVAGRLKLYK